MVTSSGMSAVLLVTQLLSPNDLLIAPHDCYGGTYRLFESLAKKGAFQLSFIDVSNSDALNNALERKPKIVWIETPSNPLLRIVDIKQIALKGHASQTLVVVDNTFMSPVLQRPIMLGADIVIHSTTKYINGHSDGDCA